MADGEDEVRATTAQTPATVVVDDRSRWFDLRTRNGTLRLCLLAAVIALVGVLLLNYSPAMGFVFIREPFLTSISAWSWLATAASLALLPAILLLLDPPDNMGTGPGLPMPLVTLGLLGILAFAAAVLKYWPQAAGWFSEEGQTLTAPLVTFFTLLSVAFVGRAWNAALFARYARDQYENRRVEASKASARGDEQAQELVREVRDHRDEQESAEAISAFIATSAVILIGYLAYLAGDWTQTTRISGAVGLFIAAGILGIFAVVILLDWIAELPPVRSLGRLLGRASYVLAPLANFYNFVDDLLVRIGAHAAGTGHLNPVARYGVLAGTQLCLAIMAWCLPDPLGLIPAALGLILALSVSRLWAWVEEDRNLALITSFNPNSPRRIGFKEDYRDEAIFGFLFLLALIPIALKQADAGHFLGLQYFEGADPQTPLPWIIYVCFELAKALPIVDWADIYLDPDNFETLKPIDPWGQHATFLARAMVDLILVASLLQAINIALRNRQQKALYRARQIDRLDEMVEREELNKVLARPRDRWFDGPIHFGRYNLERLRELHANSQDQRRREFIEIIFDRRKERVGPAIQALEQLAKRRASSTDLEQTLLAVKQEHAQAIKTGGKTDVSDLQPVFEYLRAVEGFKPFKLALLDFAEQVGYVDEPEAPVWLARLLRIIIYSTSQDQQTYTRVHAGKILLRIIPHLPDIPIPDTPDPSTPLVTELLRDHITARESVFGSAKRLAADIELALRRRLQELGRPVEKS